MGSHAFCASCFESYAQEQISQSEALVRQRKAVLVCPCRSPHDANCTGCFSEQTIALILPPELHAAHMDQLRAQIQAEEFTKANDVLTSHLSNIAEKVQQDLPCALLERQLKAALPGARQCGGCGFGPIVHVACSDLQPHHNEGRGQTRINNACPQCGWFRRTIQEWPCWEGKVHKDAAVVPKSWCHSDESIEPTQARSRQAQSQARSSTELVDDLHRQEESRLAQIHADHEFALRLSRLRG